MWSRDPRPRSLPLDLPSCVGTCDRPLKIFISKGEINEVKGMVRTKFLFCYFMATTFQTTLHLLAGPVFIILPAPCFTFFLI